MLAAAHRVRFHRGDICATDSLNGAANAACQCMVKVKKMAMKVAGTASKTSESERPRCCVASVYRHTLEINKTTKQSTVWRPLNLASIHSHGRIVSCQLALGRLGIRGLEGEGVLVEPDRDGALRGCKAASERGTSAERQEVSQGLVRSL